MFSSLVDDEAIQHASRVDGHFIEWFGVIQQCVLAHIEKDFQFSISSSLAWLYSCTELADIRRTRFFSLLAVASTTSARQEN